MSYYTRIAKKGNPYHDENGRFSSKDTQGKDTLSEEGIQALKAYTASGGQDAGKYKNTAKGREDLNNWLKSGTYKGEIWRGVGFSEEQWAEVYEEYITPGKIIMLPKISSFTKDRARASAYGSGFSQIRLRVDKVTGRDISALSHYPEENEILVPAGVKLKVVSAEYKNSIWYITTKEHKD